MARPENLRRPDPAKAGRAHKCVRVALRPEVYASAKAALRDGESVPDLVGVAVAAEVAARRDGRPEAGARFILPNGVIGTVEHTRPGWRLVFVDGTPTFEMFGEPSDSLLALP